MFDSLFDSTPPHIKKAKDSGLFKGPSLKEFTTNIQIETFYGFHFPYFKIDDRKFIINLFNGEIKSFDLILDYCIIVLYYYLYAVQDYSVFPKTFAEYENKTSPDSFNLFGNDKRMIHLNITYLKGIRDKENLINYCESKYLTTKNSECLDILLEHFEGTDKNKFLEYKVSHLSSIRIPYAEILNQILHLKNHKYNHDVIVKGIKDNESGCFDILFNYYGSDIELLQKIFLEIGHISNKSCEMNLPILMDKIREKNPNYFINLIKSKQELKSLFDNNSNYYGFLAGVLFTVLIYNIFGKK